MAVQACAARGSVSSNRGAIPSVIIFVHTGLHVCRRQAAPHALPCFVHWTTS